MPCPECGTKILGEAITLFGIPSKAAHSSSWRKLAWILTILGWITIGIFGPLLLGNIHWTFLIACIVFTLGTSIYLIATNQRERSSIERLIITNSCVVRMPKTVTSDNRNLGSVILPIHPPYCRASFKRISPTWRRMTIDSVNSRTHIVMPVVEIGYRCSDTDAPVVEQAIRQLLSGQSIQIDGILTSPSHPPTTPLSLRPARRL